MASTSFSGRFGLTKVFTAVATPGTTVSFAFPVKTFIIKPVGGDITFRFNTADADSDAFPIADGDAIQFNITPPYESGVNVATIGFIIGSNIPVYVAIGF